MGNTFWSEQEDLVIKNNISKISYKDMVDLLPNRTSIGIRQRAKKIGCRSNTTIGQWKNKYNLNYFSIPNIENSYWAGFICADGCVLKDKRYYDSWIFVLKLSIKDELHLDKFIKNIEYIGNKNYNWQKSPSSESVGQLVKIQINNAKQWSDDLLKYFGICQNKTYRTIPPNFINIGLEAAFIRGLWDGDGCISIINSKENGKRLCMKITSASKKILEYVQIFCDKNIIKDYNYRGRSSNLIKSGNSNYAYNLYFNGVKAAILFDYLSKLNTPYLERKWDNPEAIEMVNIYKQKHPQFFINNSPPPEYCK